VSKETSGPPTLPRRSETKQLGSNDFRPHYVYTSRVKTECTRERGWSGECVLRCVETTMLYDGDTLMSETLDDFTSECPNTDDEEDYEDTTLRTIKHTIRDGPTPSVNRAEPDTYESTEYDIIDSVETSDEYNGDRDGNYNDYP